MSPWWWPWHPWCPWWPWCPWCPWWLEQDDCRERPPIPVPLRRARCITSWCNCAFCIIIRSCISESVESLAWCLVKCQLWFVFLWNYNSYQRRLAIMLFRHHLRLLHFYLMSTIMDKEPSHSSLPWHIKCLQKLTNC